MKSLSSLTLVLKNFSMEIPEPTLKPLMNSPTWLSPLSLITVNISPSFFSSLSKLSGTFSTEPSIKILSYGPLFYKPVDKSFL